MLARRAQLGWAFLIIIVPALFAATYLVVLSFRDDYEGNSVPFAEVASSSVYSRQYAETVLRFVVKRAVQESDVAPFRERFEERFVALMREYDSGDARFGTFFKDVTERKQYTLTEAGGVYTLKVSGIQQTTRSVNGKHQITRTFDLEVRFTRDGLL
ncbi:MAG: hypothetical protein AABX53_02140 [Nanoarchaeota archaeon]